MISIDTEKPVTTKRVVVIDPSLVDFVGHHAQYDISVLEACKAENIKGCVLAHRSVSASIDNKIPVVGVFSEDMWGAVRAPQFSWIDIKLFLLGCLSSVLVPLLAKRHLARFKRWWVWFTSHAHRKVATSVRNETTFRKFIVFAGIGCLPYGVFSLARHKAQFAFIRLFRAFTPPVVFLVADKLKNLLWWVVPPIFLRKKWYLQLLALPAHLVFGVVQIVRFATPNLFIQVFSGMVQKLHVENFLGRLSPRLLSLMFQNPRYYFEAISGLKTVDLGPGDLVFFHMVIGRNALETASLCEYIFLQTGIPPVVLLRYPPSFLSGIHPISIKLAIRKFEHLFELEKIRLSSDSHRLIDEYEKVTYVPFELFPIPHGSCQLPKEYEVLSSDKRITIASLGNARGEKGFIEICQMIRQLASGSPNVPVKFVIQANDPDSDAAPYVKELKETRFPFPVELVESSLDKESYESLFESVDVVLAPYWQEIYSSRTSGIALEAIVGGKVLITTKDTWMSDQANLWQTGLGVENRDPDSLMENVLTAINNIMELTSRSIIASQAAAKFHSRQCFVAHLLRREVSGGRGNKNACFFYPWDNLFQYTSGASVRSSLLVRKIVEAGWNVTVVGHVSQSVMLPENIVHVNLWAPSASFANPLYLTDYVQRLLFSPRMLGMEDFQYRFRFWMRSRSSKLVINSVLRNSSAVILQYPFLATLMARFARAYQIPLICDDSDVLGLQTSKRKLSKWITKKEVEALNSSDFPYCISEEDRRVFEQLGACPQVIENSIDLEAFSLPSIENASKCLSLKGIKLPAARFGLFVGSAHPPNFIAARRVAELSQNELFIAREIGFVTVGGCILSDISKIPINFAQLGIVSHEILRALYALASFVIIPLESGTGSSLKTLEAFAYGKAVIGTDTAFRSFEVINSHHCIISNNFNEYPNLIIDLVDNIKKIGIERSAKDIAKRRDYRTTYQPVISAMEAHFEKSVGDIC